MGTPDFFGPCPACGARALYPSGEGIVCHSCGVLADTWAPPLRYPNAVGWCHCPDCGDEGSAYLAGVGQGGVEGWRCNRCSAPVFGGVLISARGLYKLAGLKSTALRSRETAPTASHMPGPVREGLSPITGVQRTVDGNRPVEVVAMPRAP